jgi:SOS-response transcriptional repressor LexA
VSEESLIKEIMEEVENLQNSIVEYCPEVISNSQYPSIKEMGDDMNKLIEHRIQLLTKYQEEQETSQQD